MIDVCDTRGGQEAERASKRTRYVTSASGTKPPQLCHDGAAELSGEVGSHFRTSKTPADKIMAFLALAMTLMRLDTSFAMPLIHGV